MLRLKTAIFALLASACDGGTVRVPEFTVDQCHRVQLRDAVADEVISGAEDLAYDHFNDRLIVSAYDRRAIEKARDKTQAPIASGVFSVPLSELASGSDQITVASLIDRTIVDGGLRPHGLAIDPATGKVAFINRQYSNDAPLTATLIVIDETGTVEMHQEIHCASNDVVFNDADILVSRDHRHCGARAFWENVVNAKSGGVYSIDRGWDVEGVSFANGLAVSNGEHVLAATRARALYDVSISNNGAELSPIMKLKGAPDNISIRENKLIIAEHPSLMRLALARKMDIGRAPSRITTVDVTTMEHRLLFEDKDGALFQAATSAVLLDEMLVVGSVLDEGLLVCQGAA